MTDTTATTPPAARTPTKQWILLGVLLVVLTVTLRHNWDSLVTILQGPPTGVLMRENAVGSSSHALQITPVADGFDPRTVIPNRFPAIKDAAVVTAASIVEGTSDLRLDDSELVLGIEIGGHARAYPINMLTGPQREIINDVVGDVPLAATW